MRLKKKVDSLEALILDRTNSIDEVLKRLLGRVEVIKALQEIVVDLREERKELFNRLMARNFESYQIYTADGKQETVGEDIPLEENVDIAGEVFSVPLD